jgi:hypothetical protein
MPDPAGAGCQMAAGPFALLAEETMADFSWAQILVPIGTAAIGLFGGVKLSRYQFDLNTQRSEKKAASALREDLHRIDASLGQSANAFGSTVYGLTFEPPAVHRWAEPLIVQLAAADSRIVSKFMDLDRELNNFSATVSLFRLAAKDQEDAQEAKKKAFEVAVEEGLSNGELLKRAGDRVTAEIRAKNAAEPVANAVRLMKDHHAKAREIITTLLRYTSVIADAPDREFMQLPEELPKLAE